MNGYSWEVFVDSSSSRLKMKITDLNQFIDSFIIHIQWEASSEKWLLCIAAMKWNQSSFGGREGSCFCAPQRLFKSVWGAQLITPLAMWSIKILCPSWFYFQRFNYTSSCIFKIFYFFPEICWLGSFHHEIMRVSIIWGLFCFSQHQNRSWERNALLPLDVFPPKPESVSMCILRSE